MVQHWRQDTHRKRNCGCPGLAGSQPVAGVCAGRGPAGCGQKAPRRWEVSLTLPAPVPAGAGGIGQHVRPPVCLPIPVIIDKQQLWTSL